MPLALTRASPAAALRYAGRRAGAEIEAEFYEYLTSALPADEAAAFAATLHKLYTASKTESRAGFQHFKQATEGEAEHAE